MRLLGTIVYIPQAITVPQDGLFHVLCGFVCVAMMLTALFDMYSITGSAISSVVITVTLGVRQGLPTACFTRKNDNVPHIVKQSVFDTALMSSICSMPVSRDSTLTLRLW